MKRNKSRRVRKSLLTNSTFSHDDDLSEESYNKNCKHCCLATNRPLHGHEIINDEIANHKTRFTLLNDRDITLNGKLKRLLRFSDEQRENDSLNGRCNFACNNKTILPSEFFNRDWRVNEKARPQHRVNDSNVRREELRDKLLSRNVRLHQLVGQRQQSNSNCHRKNTSSTIMDDDTVFGSPDLSDAAEAHQKHEQNRRMNYDELSNHFFADNRDRDNGFAAAAAATKHETDAARKQLKRANQILKIKLKHPRQQQQHLHRDQREDLNNLNQLNRQDLCQLAKSINIDTLKGDSNNNTNSIENNGKTDSSLRPLKLYRHANTRDYYALPSCNCNVDQTKLDQINGNRHDHVCHYHRCRDHGNFIEDFDSYQEQNRRRQQTGVKLINSDHDIIDDNFLKSIAGDSSLLDFRLLEAKTETTKSTTIKSSTNLDDYNELNLTSSHMTNEKFNSELKSLSKSGNLNNTSHDVDVYSHHNKSNPDPINSGNNSDGTAKTEKENTLLAIEKKLSGRAVIKPARTLPASLKKLGNFLSTQAETSELIDKFNQLDNLDRIELEEKRKSYRPMNWSYIANIYKHQKPSKSTRSKSKSSNVTKIGNPANNKSDKINKLEVIENPMFSNKLNETTSKDASNLGDSGRNSNHEGNNNNIIQMGGIGQSTICSKLKRSWFCQLLVNSIHNLFPILDAFDGYSVPDDLIGDLFTGLTIAILQVPQGMAYGMLAGVDPIHGLYVSLIPVLVMAFLSKSLHVSYGTFAIISILLASSTESIRSKIETSQISIPVVGSQTPPVVENTLQLNQASRIGGSKQSQIITSLASNNPVILSLASDTGNPLIAQQHPSSLLEDSYGPTNVEILTAICITVGILQLLMALFRMGHLAVIFSDQLVSSFTCASAFHVLTSQIAGLFDLDTPPVSEGLFKVCRTWWHVFHGLIHNDTLEGSPSFNHYTAMLSLLSIAFLLGIKEILEPCLRARNVRMAKCLPSELILMTCIVFSSWYWQFSDYFGVRIVGHIPTGFPAPKLPPVEVIPYALQDAVTIALVSYAMNLSLAQVYAKRFRYKMDSNQELFALGSANLIGSFFSCFPCASSLSRSALQSNLNARSPLTPIFSCAIVFSIIAYFAPILHDLPKSTLSCIIIIALKGVIMQCRDLTETWRLSKLDASTWLVTFWAVIAFGVTYGLVIGIISSLLTIFFRILTPNYTILGQLPGTDIYVDKSAFEDCEEIEQVRIFRFNSPLCYMNRTMFRARVESALPDVFKKFNYMKVFRPRKIDMERDHILACNHHDHQQQLISTTSCIQINKNNNVNNYGGLSSSSNKSSNNTDKMMTVRYFIIDCSALAYCDHAGATLLLDLIQELEGHKVTVYLAACPIKLVFMFERMGSGSILESHVYPTITAAVNQARFLRDSGGSSNNPATSIYRNQQILE